MNAVGRPEEPLAPTSALDAVVAGGLELARLGAAQGLPVPFADASRARTPSDHARRGEREWRASFYAVRGALRLLRSGCGV